MFLNVFISSIIIYQHLLKSQQQNQEMRTRSQSVGVLTLQKQLQKLKGQKEFVPFVNERKLGKLISENNNKQETKKKESIDEINFKNFKRIYNRQKVIQNARYSRMTRKSQQQDLISNREDWKINKVKSEINFRKITEMPHTRNCCAISVGQKKQLIQKFDKIDQDVYKKIVVSKPGQHVRNPEVNTLFKHYVEVCQLNENIRRMELTRKTKY